MATRAWSPVLSRAQRRWRMKVFTATWLSYVGFYFCRKPFSAAKATIGKEMHWDATTLANIYAGYLIAYAIGQFMASGMGTRLGPRVNVLLGMGLSVGVTVGMGLTSDPWVMAGLIAVNGLSQATGWSGNVGTMAGWFHKHERGRVMGLWSTNFTVGSLTSAWVMGWVLAFHDEGQTAPWRWCFFTGAMVLSVIWIQYYFWQRNKPEDVGLPHVDEMVGDYPEDPAPAATTGQPRAPTTPAGFMGLSRQAWTNLLLVGGFYFFAKLVRYALWSWSPYFLEVNYGLTGTRANVYATAFELCGMPGVYVTGWLSDRYFGSKRAGVALFMMVGMTIATGLLVAFGASGMVPFTILLGAVGFTLYGPDALLSGAGAMDIGGRDHATFVTGVIAGFGAAGPILQEVVIARLYDAKGGNLTPVFVLLFLSAAAATVFCLALVLRNRKGRGI